MQARRIQTILSHMNPKGLETFSTSADLNSEQLRQLINRQMQTEGIQLVTGASLKPEFLEILTPAALTFVANLNRKFNARRLELLAKRQERQKEIDAGKFPTFLAETQHIRDGDWKVAPIPRDIQDRRVEITGPVDRKMVINALNSGASCFMADFEDSHTPTFENNIYGHINMRDAVRRTISFKAAEGKEYKLNPTTAVLFVRPRGWHLDEKYITLDGAPISGSLYDFALYFFHNAAALLERGSGPYFYLPKMESHLEARLWNDVFNYAQDELGIPRGTIRATVLIETILAAFEMDEILYELRDHSAGLNCGRWDYIFSYIKKFRNHPQCILPERGQVTMTVPFMKAYVELLIKTCHKRGIHAMGGMAAQIPVRDNPELNKAAMDKVTADKLREVTAGHDGTWVAHPGLVPLAKKVFDEHMKTPNQIHVTRSEVNVAAADLLKAAPGTITAAGLRGNVEVAIRYMEAWLRGVGCVPIHNMMEDAATAEISRSQIWQWIRHGAKTTDGVPITAEYVKSVFAEVMSAIQKEAGPKYAQTKYELAGQLVLQMSIGEYRDFLTTVAYENM